MWSPLVIWQKITLPPDHLPAEYRRSFEIMAEIYLFALISQFLVAPVFYLTGELLLAHLNLACLLAYACALALHHRLKIATALSLKIGAFLVLVAYASTLGGNGSMVFYLLFAEIELALSGLRRRSKILATGGLIAFSLMIFSRPRVHETLPLLEMLLSQVGVAMVFVMVCVVILRALSITDHHEYRYRREAMHDSLTLVLNRRAVFERASRLWRSDQPFSIILVDADHFKEINDNHGHTAGDAVLRHIAGQLRDTVRRDDLVGRVGGEEFLLLLPGATRQEALEITRCIRERLVSDPCRFNGQTLSITLSMGIAHTADGETLEAVVELADRRLYAAKSGGRDRVVTHDHIDSPPSSNAQRLVSGASATD